MDYSFGNDFVQVISPFVRDKKWPSLTPSNYIFLEGLTFFF